MAVKVPADRRFHRGQLRASKRRRPVWRTAFRLVVFVAVMSAVGYGSYRAADVLAASPALRVEHITVRGNHRVSTGEVLAVLEGLRGESLITADLDHWRQRLMASPWLRDAAFRRQLPTTVEVSVVEREPIGIARVGRRLYLVDREGMVIDEYGSRYAGFDFPLLDGLSVSSGEDRPVIDPERAERAARLLEDVSRRPGLLERISQIDLADQENAIVLLAGDEARLYLGDEAFSSRLQSYVELAPSLRERVPQIDYVDLRFDERVYVRPLSDGRRARAPRVVTRHQPPA